MKKSYLAFVRLSIFLTIFSEITGLFELNFHMEFPKGGGGGLKFIKNQKAEYLGPWYVALAIWGPPSLFK